MVTLTMEGGGFCDGDPPEPLVALPHPERAKSRMIGDKSPRMCRGSILSRVPEGGAKTIENADLRFGMALYPPQQANGARGSAELSQCTDLAQGRGLAKE